MPFGSSAAEVWGLELVGAVVLAKADLFQWELGFWFLGDARFGRFDQSKHRPMVDRASLQARSLSDELIFISRQS